MPSSSPERFKMSKENRQKKLKQNLFGNVVEEAEAVRASTSEDGGFESPVIIEEKILKLQTQMDIAADELDLLNGRVEELEKTKGIGGGKGKIKSKRKSTRRKSKSKRKSKRRNKTNKRRKSVRRKSKR
jgi:hypothetical protein